MFFLLIAMQSRILRQAQFHFRKFSTTVTTAMAASSFRSFMHALKPSGEDPDTLHTLRTHCVPLSGSSQDYDQLLKDIPDDAKFVLIGEASHGTHEFYKERAKITQRLITEKGFCGVCLESDFPDTAYVNAYVKGGFSKDAETVEALAQYARFPHWMWRNTVMLEFVGWLREYNDKLAREHKGEGAEAAARRKVGVYGFDLYSLFSSIQEVLRYLHTVDPRLERRVASFYSCFEGCNEDSQEYGQLVSAGISKSCHDEAVEALVTLQRSRAELIAKGRPAGRTTERLSLEGTQPGLPAATAGAGGSGSAGAGVTDLTAPAAKIHSAVDVDSSDPEYAEWHAEVNASVVASAEQYYREMFKGRINTWNLRDKHMAETLFGLQAFLSARRGGSAPARLVVWAHNSHLGDARATEVSRKGEWNVGQLVREKFPFPQSFLLGQTTYTGTVTAAHNWDGPAERKRVRPGLAGSSEELLHKVGIPSYYVRLSEGPVAAVLRPPRLHRAIGVIYRPKTERWSHYFESNLSAQYDAIVHTDETRALEPLERSPRWVGGEEETYPEGY